jgi:propanediol dehydratase small subunit
MAKSEGQKQSQKHEKRLAKAVGGQTTAASGAFWSRKGDVRSDKMLIEHKWTGKLTKTISSKELKKITVEAVMDGRFPVFGIHLDGEDYVILLETDFLELWDMSHDQSI